MMQLLPIEILDWVDPKNINLDNYSDNGSKECFLEIGFDYIDKLHYLHNNFPLAPEKKVIKEMLSEYIIKIINIMKIINSLLVTTKLRTLFIIRIRI